jgi:predicted ArsR family transcriptional regulator
MTSKVAAARAKAAEYKIKSMEMRKLGMTFSEIGNKLGISRQAAHKHVQKTMAEYNQGAKEQAKEYRTLNLMRLESILAKTYMNALNGATQSVREARMLIKDISTLVGADMPTKTAHTTADGEKDVLPGNYSNMTEAEIDARIAELQEKMSGD